MLIIKNLQLEKEIDLRSTKRYILSLHNSDSKFTDDMDYWTFSFTLVLYCAS